MNLFEKISKQELDMISHSITYGSHTVSGCRADLSHVLRVWEENKNEFLFKLFGNELILKKEISYHKSVDSIERDIMEKIFNTCLFEDFFVELREKMAVLKDYYNIEDALWHLNLLCSYHNFATNSYKGNGFTFPVSRDKEIAVPNNCKPVKILGKIAKAYNITDTYEKLRLAHSMVLNNTKASGELCLSIHPLDYITMSDNDNGWESCMSWEYEGEYRIGTIEMMNSPLVIVAYMPSAHTTYSIGSHEWNSKKWRSLYIIDPEIVAVNVKGYPYQNSDLDNIVLDWLVELAHTNLGIDMDKTPYKYIPFTEQDYNEKSGYVSLNNNQDFYFKFITDDMYNDFGTLNYHSCRVNLTGIENCCADNDVSSSFVINYSGEATCMCCGSTSTCFDGTATIVCESCDSRCRCDCCGDRIYEDEAVEFDDELFCTYCFNNETSECPFTQERHYNAHMHSLRIYATPSEMDIKAIKAITEDSLEIRQIYFERTMSNWNNVCVTSDFFDSDLYDKYFKEIPCVIIDCWGCKRYCVFESDLTTQARELLKEQGIIYRFFDELEEDYNIF